MSDARHWLPALQRLYARYPVCQRQLATACCKRNDIKHFWLSQFKRELSYRVWTSESSSLFHLLVLLARSNQKIIILFLLKYSLCLEIKYSIVTIVFSRKLFDLVIVIMSIKITNCFYISFAYINTYIVYINQDCTINEEYRAVTKGTDSLLELN